MFRTDERRLRDITTSSPISQATQTDLPVQAGSLCYIETRPSKILRHQLKNSLLREFFVRKLTRHESFP